MTTTRRIAFWIYIMFLWGFCAYVGFKSASGQPVVVDARFISIAASKCAPNGGLKSITGNALGVYALHCKNGLQEPDLRVLFTDDSTKKTETPE